MFRAGVFTEHFWQNVVINADGSAAFTQMTASGLIGQIQSSLMVMIWVFVGIEGAAMMGDRAKKNQMLVKLQLLDYSLCW